jgi:hypothetical protein
VWRPRTCSSAVRARPPRAEAQLARRLRADMPDLVDRLATQADSGARTADGVTTTSHRRRRAGPDSEEAARERYFTKLDRDT